MKKSVCLSLLVFLNMAVFAAGRFSPLGVSITRQSQFPDSYDSVFGWRLALFSGAHSHMVGFATAVFANDDASVRGSVGGLQTAILFNTANDCELGAWQLSGVYNRISGNGNGLQLCPVYNVTDGYFNGLQIAMYNEAKSDCVGAQLGLINRGGAVFGMQIGLFNAAKSLQGVQLGLLNFVDTSRMSMFPVVRIGW